MSLQQDVTDMEAVSNKPAQIRVRIHFRLICCIRKNFGKFKHNFLMLPWQSEYFYQIANYRMMKKLTSIILAAVFAPASCNTFDHEAILEQLCDHWQRI